MIACRRVPAPRTRMLNTLSFIVAVVVAAASHCRLPNILPICRSVFTSPLGISRIVCCSTVIAPPR
ncbi:hypothetical protein NP493_473g00024 [Ridgeia piscesae]|uniref:Secreted protein n=1 Tax=Ridgeia piscesae TaxID=27915 RepID=A0AAD9NT64_RIDPI|nr:hypothetical protein NP493_473g00024 [Ridgeia piscesae]